MRTKYFLYFLLFLSFYTNAQLSNKHWIPPLHANESSDADLVKDHYIYLSTPVATSFQVTVTNGNGLEIAGSPFTISQGNPVRITIGNEQPSAMMLDRSDVGFVQSNRGLILEGQYDFYVSFRVRHQNHAEFLSSKGRTGMGTTFRLGSLPQTSTGGIRNFVASFMATEDNTTVNLSNYAPAITFIVGNSTGTFSNQTFTLNEGQSVVVSGYSNTTPNLSGFVGALLTSDKPIVVNSGNMTGGMLGEFDGQDFNLDQIVPLEQVGTEYIVMKGNGSTNSEHPLVIAHEDNTDVFINGSTVPNATLNAGEYFLIPTSFFQGIGSNLNMYIETSKPAFVYQIVAGSLNDATTGMFFIPPVSCFWQKSVDLIPDVNKIGSTLYSGGAVLIATEALDASGNPTVVSINGTPTSASPVAVTGNPNWVTYRIPNLSGDVAVSSTSAVAVGVFGAASAAGYGGYFSGFGSIPSSTVVDVCDGGIIDLFEKIPGNPDEGGTWTFNGTPRNPDNGLFDPSIDALGDYTYTFSKTCDGITEEYPLTVTVNSIQPGPTAGTSTSKSYCVTDESENLADILGATTAITAGGNWTYNGTSIPNGILNPATAQSGDYTYSIPSNGICDAISATVTVTIVQSPNLVTVSDFELCDDEVSGSTTDGLSVFNLTEKDSEIIASQTDVSVKYYELEADAEANASNTITSITASTGTTVYFRIENTNGCYLVSSFNLTVFENPDVLSNVTLRQCDDDNDAIANFVLTQANDFITTATDVTISYHNTLAGAESNTDLVADESQFNALNGTIVWTRTENSFGCSAITEVNLVVSTTQIPSTFSPNPLEECDVYIDDTNGVNDGYSVFDIDSEFTNTIITLFPTSQQAYLSVSYYESYEDAELLQNEITATTAYTNTTINSQTIYARVDSSLNSDSGCKGIQELELVVNPLPENNLGEITYVCVDPSTGIGSEIIDATATETGNYTYEWSSNITDLDLSSETSSTYTATQEGIYYIVVTNIDTGCSSSFETTVAYSSEPLTFTAEVETPAFSSSLTTIVTTAEGGYGTYEYSLDLIEWQSNPTFLNLPNGNYTVYVRDIQGCGVKYVENLYAITYPNFFTPNGDGYNDNWIISGLPESFAAKIYIFDRYGKLIKQISPDGEGWDGTFNGQPLPATDYWFRIDYVEDNNAKQFSSHFSLKR